MAEGQKRYYWLKLQNDFFSRKEIKRLRRIAGGDTLTIIYLKMLCRSLKDNGKLYYDGLDNDFVSELAMDIDEDTENVQITVNYLIRTGLLEQIDEDEYTLKDAESNTGTETAVAARVRKHRERQKALQCNTDVTAVKQLGNVKIEKEIEKENKSKKDKTYSPSLPSVAEDIVTFLNSVTGSSYRSTTSKTRKLIAARLAEGFTADDFKAVISKKAKEWQNTDMAQYLRPETLFGTKFEGYLNQPEVRNNMRSPISRAEQERQEGIAAVNRLIAEYEEEERQNEQIGHNESHSTFTTGV